MNSEHSTQNSVNEEGKKLDSIMADYASIWADVLYCKNLEKHLKGIDFDILLLDLTMEYYYKQNTDRLATIRNDILKLKKIVQAKINKSF